MSGTARHLPRGWPQRLLDLAAPLLADGRLVVRLAGSEIAATGAVNAAADAAGSVSLTMEDAVIGAVEWQARAAKVALVARCAEFCAHALQGVLDAEHARRAVGQEALESYRETALLQRAVAAFNATLKPAAVVEALLREFNGHKDSADCGAVFQWQTDGAPELAQCFGDGATEAFAKLRQSALFERIASDEVGDIVDTRESAAAVAEFTALLWLPLATHAERLGLLVLALRRDGTFTAADRRRAQTLATIAAGALRNAQLYAAQQEMFSAFVRVMATAIDAKSPYTAGHCRRVPEIALMLADAAHGATDGPFAGFTLDEDERNALELAAMLHDFGKVVTPEHVVDKAAKLERVVDRLELVALRFEILRRDAASAFERERTAGAAETAAEDYRIARQRLDADWQFLATINTGANFMDAAALARLDEIAGIRWRDAAGNEHPLLDADEVHNLRIPRGTLNAQERKIIEDHAVHTFNMLSQIPFPRGLRNVPDYAASHHERLDGSGYPRGLNGEQLSVPARIVAIADIFEALTAADRPYRKASSLSWAIDVMDNMKRQRHIDADLFDLLLAEDIHLAYAQKHLLPGQIDAVDVGRYLGSTVA